MLVLTRKTGQNIAIGNEIRISVIEIKGRQVRLGIEAPGEMPIHREEVLLRIQVENQEAAGPSVEDLSQVLDLFTQGRDGDAK
ncbi:MAG: carbon storage regulator CsrA [Deltaproteobacteria bacterium]|nr:carbon storage regulator CsrA [Deltaproteobacteria bacterium]